MHSTDQMYPQPVYYQQPVYPPSATQTADPLAAAFAAVALVLALFVYFGRKGLSRTAHGTAAWMSNRELWAWGLRGRTGLVFGRSLGGHLLRLNKYVHTIIIGGTGSGKGVGLIIPILLTYLRGSLVAFDPKGELARITGKSRARFGRVVVVAPFDGGARWNPLSTVPADDPLLDDKARALANSFVPQNAKAHEPHWDQRAVMVIAAAITLVLKRFPPDTRNLNSVYEIVCDAASLRQTAAVLKGMGGLCAVQGASLLSLFDGAHLTKEGASVVSVASRHLDFLASPSVAASVAVSDFDPAELLKTPGNTLYIQIPESQLIAQAGYLRCVTSTLMRIQEGSRHECLFVLDECSALNGLPALEEALVRGRSSGIRLLLAYQSDAQVQAAFPEKPTLIFDNCSAQIYLGAGSIETAERVSRALGNYTLAVTSFSDNDGRSRNPDSAGVGTSWGSSSSTSVIARALLTPDEVLRLPDTLLIAFVTGLPGPILARRIKYYADRHFRRLLKPRRGWVIALAVLIALAAAVAATVCGGTPVP